MTEAPELGAVIQKLEALAGMTVDPDIPLQDLAVSSLDLVEWTVLLEDEYDIDLASIDIDDIRALTPRLLYKMVLDRKASAAAEQAPSSSLRE